MTAKLTAEWRKLATTRTLYWLLAGAATVAAVGAFSTTSATTEPPWHMTTPLHQQTMWVLATINGAIFAIIIGARVFTDEFRHSTIVHTYIADPNRRASTAAKTAVAGLAGLLTGTVVVAALLVVSLIMAATSGGQVSLHGSDLLPTAGLLAGMSLWAVMGAGFGAIVRNQVAVVAGGLIWILMLENLGAALLKEAGRYLPGQAVHAMAQTRDALKLLDPGSASVLMAAYAMLFVTAGLAIIRRRDIT